MSKISGFFAGLAPIVIGGIFCVLIYDSWPNLYGIIVIGLIGILSLLVARSIYLTTSRIGGFEFISQVTASPDMDNLIPIEGGDVKLLEAKEIKDHFLTEKMFSECSIRLWGEWQGRPYVPNQIVETLDYDAEKDTLIIKFSSGNKLKVIQAQKILVAPSYLKIMRASVIVWDFQMKFHRSKGIESVSKKYIYSGTKIDTHSKASKDLRFDVSLGEAAVGIYGKIS